MTFFFDRNMSIHLARAMNSLWREHRIIPHDERFEDTTTDIEWITELAKEDPPWVVLSIDGNILKNKAEFKALQEAKLTFFCFSNAWAKMKIHEFSWRLIKAWPDVVKTAEQNLGKPQIFEINGVSSVKIDRRHF